MKRFIALTAVSLAALTGAASAATNAGEINKYAPNVDVSTLSDLEIAVLNNLIHGSDGAGEKRAKVQAFLN